MKKILVFSLISCTILFGQSKVEKNFESQGGELTPKLQKLLKKDAYFQQLVGYLEDEKMMVSKDINYTDPENPYAKKEIITQRLPDYPKALKAAIQSVNKYKNPVSAYQGLHLIKTTYGVSSKVKEFKEFAELLYKTQKGICTAYIDYGDALEKGYATKVDKSKAVEVYEEGLKQDKCKAGWYASVLGARIYTQKKMHK